MNVSVEEVKQHLRLEHDDEDDYLASLIIQAQSAAENFCRVTFDEDNDPEPVRLAVLLFVSHIYEHRDAAEPAAYETMRRAFDALLYPYRDTEKLF